MRSQRFVEGVSADHKKLQGNEGLDEAMGSCKGMAIPKLTLER